MSPIAPLCSLVLERNKRVVFYYNHTKELSFEKASNFAYKTLLPDNIPMSVNI